MNSRHSGVQDQDKNEWASSEGWDRSNVAEGSQYHQNVRLDWDSCWENSMNLSQNALFGSSTDGLNLADHNRSSLLLSGWPTQGAALRHPSQVFQAPGFSSDSNVSISGQPSSLRSSASAEALQDLMNASPGYALSSFSGASDISNELKSLEQRRRHLGILDLYQRTNMAAGDFMKAEDLFFQGDAYGRIGLNLGGRTYFSPEDSMRMGKKPHLHTAAVHLPICQAQGCTADLSRAKHYYRRHKVCEMHSKAVHVVANGQTQRFCQQCSRLHLVTEFDDAKRSCRKRLADHNRRRRKPQATASQTDSGKANIAACKRPEDNDQMIHPTNNTTDAKPEVSHSKEARSSSEAMEEFPRSNNGVETQNLDYGFFRADSNSQQTVLQLNQDQRTSPVSDAPSLRSPMDRHPSSGLLQLPGDTPHLSTIQTPEISYMQSYSSLEAGASKHKDSNLPFSLLESTGAGLEDRYQVRLPAQSQLLFDHDIKTAAPWLVAAFPKPAEEMPRSPKDFQQLMPAREDRDLNGARSVHSYGGSQVLNPS